MTEPAQQKVDLKVFMTRQNTGFIMDVSWPDLSALDKPINYVVRRDGLWEVRSSRSGVFVVQREKFTTPLPGFPEEQNSEFGISHFGKIPNQLFKEILSFFKAICDENKDEAYVQTFWDQEEKRYFNHVPLQRVSGASVNFERDTELEAKHHLVLEMHSHNTMGAFFSSTDNADEKSDRFFGVVGKLNQSSPEMLFSFVCGGKRVIVNKGDIFEEEPEAQFPGDWKSRIIKNISSPIGLSHSSQDFSMGKESSQVRRNYRGYTQSDIESEIELAINEARRKMGGANTDQPFFQETQSHSNDEALKDLVRSATARLSNGGLEMTRVQKQRMFDKLVDAMSSDDVVDLVGSMLEAGYEQSILDILPEPAEYADAVADQTTTTDPFLNE